MKYEECRRTNFSEDEAMRCFTENFGSFYDVCTDQCYIDMRLTTLFHNNQLENAVYGLVNFYIFIFLFFIVLFLQIKVFFKFFCMKIIY